MSSPSGRLSLLLFLILAAAITISSFGRVSARQTAGERTAALEVDFVALQADGTPVADLEPSEVEVRVSGRARKVLSVRRIAATAAPAGAAASVPAPYATNEGLATGRNIVLLVDQESFVTGQEQILRNAVDGLLPQLAPADRTMVVVLPYGGVKVPFTSDKERIRQAFAGIVGQRARGESGTDMGARTRTFLESLDGFLQSHAGRAVPITVVLFTAGMAAPHDSHTVPANVAEAGMMAGGGDLVVNHFKRITVTSGAARANFYIALPADVGSAGGFGETIGGARFAGSGNPLEGIEHLAGSTGGSRVPLDATGTTSLHRVAKETSAYYVANIEAERNEVYGRSRPLAVRVTRAGVTVRARPEITFAAVAAKRAGATRLEDLIVSPNPATDLPLRAAAFTVRESEEKLRVGVVVEPADAAVSFASVAAILIENSGRIAARWVAQNASQKPLLGAMAAQPGTYRLRVAAIDTAGRAGVIEDVVEARLTTVGPISLGSLMIGVSRNKTIAPQLVFGGEPSAIASFDIYGGSAGMGLAGASMEVARDVDGPALTAVPLAFTRTDESRVVATATLPLGALAPGDYVVRGVIQLQDGTTGRVIRTLRKVGS